MTQFNEPRIAEIDGKPKSRGAGQPPRKYSLWEWAQGYLAWIALFPLYLLLWGFAAAFPRLPEWLRRKLLRWHQRTTEGRERDVRIPTNPAIPQYMLRWWKIMRNPFFNIYFHKVYRSDDDAALHDHPWWSFSIVLSGGYYEHRILNGGIHEKKWYGPGSVLFRRSGSQAHRLQLELDKGYRSAVAQSYYTGNGDEVIEMRSADDGVFYTERTAETIFITGPVLRRWGFHAQERWVDAYDWDDFQASKGINSQKMAGYAEQLKKG